MLAYLKSLSARRKAKQDTDLGDGVVSPNLITREELRDLFSDVLSQKTVALR